jgi:hypothetical protein
VLLPQAQLLLAIFLVEAGPLLEVEQARDGVDGT